MKQLLGLVVALAGLTGGCLQTGTVAAGSALVHSEFPYAVSYDDERTKSVMGEEWTLENYRVAKTNLDGSVELERKKGYETTYELDFDNDDKADVEAKLPDPDLVLLHRRTNARLEVTSLLLDRRLADKELRVLLNDIVEKESGTRSLFVGFGKAAAGIQKRYASKLIESSEATLGSEKGLVATIERADLDQVQLNPNARWRRSRLFLLRAPFDYLAAGRVGGAPSPSDYHRYRVLLLVEYSNTPEDFEAQYPDFLRLLNKVHLMSDAMVLEYAAEALSKCGDKATPAKLKVQISALGVPNIVTAEGVEGLCAGPALGAFRFAAKGESRELTVSYDFNKPLKPGWLNVGGYNEERAPAAAPEAAPPAEGKPTDAQPADAPTAAPEPGAPVEAAPSVPPATPPTVAPTP